MHTAAQPRPLGPRAPANSPSLGATSPLVIRKPARPTLTVPAASPPNRSPSPKLSLSIPGRAPTPRMRLGLEIPTSTSKDTFQGGYYGGPLDTTAKTEHADEPTIRPDATATIAPQHPAISDIQSLLGALELKSSSSKSQPPSDAEDDAFLTTSPRLSWSDSVLEEVSRLGEGAGGAVHKVKDKRTGKIYARKTITTREAPMKQLLRELSIISSTEHINIILFHGAYMSPSTSEVKILMEYCEGGSLEAVSKRLKEINAVVGEKIAGRLAEGVLQGLHYLHTKKTIHRDIKPSNILLSREGVVKLCDFGVSGVLEMSLAGTFTGTSFYMAPERISGQQYSIRSDVWSTGISLLELVQNRFPFPNDLPPIELMMYITAGEPPRLEDEGELKWSDEMKDFIKQTLTVDASLRPTPGDMLAHPWVVDAMKQEVHMARWIRKVWNWPKATRRSRDHNSISQREGSPSESPKPNGS
ncbi:STE/STE7 protein kinase [Mycena indigotica]|uniref:mitogen-activated protein kinase kinase n=1 Tax=Mycena indigotica TaxID=2126181 RepID=A0A8H6TD10_9AGAR|nr:STE/STE7 protein kinase [Mycena indigotica]KAF7315443.1 STE/STE7 protein kinase [Mycena indigotica]